MTRMSIIEYHANSSKQVITHKDGTTDKEMLEHIVRTLSIHKIKAVTTVTVDASYSNVSPITTWLMATERLTA